MIRPKRIGWRRWLLAALLIGFLWVLAQRFADIQQLIGTLVRGNWLWISAAVVLEIGYYLAFAALFQSAFRITEVAVRYRDLIPISFAFLFANTTTASGGTAGLALFVDDARRRGESAARATAGTLLAHTANYGMFAALLSLGLFFLYLQNDLTGLEVVSALILFLLVLVLVGVLVLGLRWHNVLRRLLATMQQVVGRAAGWVKRPSPLPDNWANKNANDFIAASQAIAAHPAKLGQLLLLALLTHVVNLLLMLTLFAAFRQPVSLGVLLAGYTLSQLFMIVSPTPNGIGVVETVVPLMYSSLGIPSENGIAITFAFRGITFWVPMVIGFILLRQLKMFGGSGRSLAESGQVRLIAVLTALMGLVNVLTAVQPTLLAPLTPLTQLSPVAVQQGSQITAAISGFILLILANGLWRHKRMAWGLTLLMLTLSILSHLVQNDLTAAILGLILVFVLIVQRSHFVARSDPPSAWQGVQVLLAALIFMLAYGTIGYYLLDQYYGRSFDLLGVWQRVVLLFTTITEPTLQPATAYDYFADSIYIVGLATVAYALFMLLRPVLLPPPATRRERHRARRIAAQFGHTPLAALVHLPDRAYFFSTGGSVVAYIHRRRLAIALGEPVGPEDDRETAVFEFADFCREHDWEAAFYLIPQTAVGDYLAANFELMVIGEEALLPLSDFPPPPPLPGYQVQIQRPPFADALIEQMRLVSDEWLALHGAAERPFTADRFSRAYLQGNVVALLTDSSGAIVAIATAYPTPHKQDLAIGLLRFRQSVPETALRLLLQTLAHWGASNGFHCFYFGLTPLLPDDVALPTTAYWTRFWQRLYLRRRQEPVSHSPLHLLIDQQPEMAPRYLAYSRASALPAISATLFPLDRGE